MNWYYTVPEGRRGPVDQAQLLRLVEEGKIGPETLMWQLGWPDLVPYKYKEIIAQTPYVKAKTAIITWVLLAIVLALFVGAIAFIYLKIIR